MRGFDTPETARCGHRFADLLQAAAGRRAADMLLEARAGGEGIVIYHDYDADEL